MWNYLTEVWRCRHLWYHLAAARLRSQYRHSYLGVLWACLRPLLLTGLICLVFGTIMGHSMRSYAPYVFSGLLFWRYVCTVVTSGCSSLFGSASYILEQRKPLIIYPLKETLSAFVVCVWGFLGLAIWSLAVAPARLTLAWLVLPLSFFLLLLGSVPLATISAVVNTRFPDFQQMTEVLLRGVWYISPIFLRESVFRKNGLDFLVDYNPIWHFLRLFRAPILEGHMPSPINYLYACTSVALLLIVSAYTLKRTEPRLVYYL